MADDIPISHSEVHAPCRLAQLLALVDEIDHQPEATRDYDRRNLLTWRALAEAGECGYRAGVRIDPAEPEWPVVYIDLPTGQVSWHTPAYPAPWDGHTTAQKYQRVRRYIRKCPGGPMWPPSLTASIRGE